MVYAQKQSSRTMQGRSTHNGLCSHGRIGFFGEPHPVQLRAQDYVIATKSGFWQKNTPKLLISLTNTLTSIFGGDLSKTKQVINLTLQSAWYRQWLWLHYIGIGAGGKPVLPSKEGVAGFQYWREGGMACPAPSSLFLRL